MNFCKGLSILYLVFFSCYSNAMMPISQGENKAIWISTHDNKMILLDRWKAEQMNAISKNLERQGGTNSYDNPLYATELTWNELYLLDQVFDVVKIGEFDSYFHNPALSLQQNVDKLRTVINAAQKADAASLSALCASYVLPGEIQPLVVQDIIHTIAHIFCEPKKKELRSNEGLTKKVQFSPDEISLVTCGAGKNRLGIWDVSTGALRHSLGVHPFFVQAVAFSPDSAKIVSGSKGVPNLLVWDALTGVLEHTLIGQQEDIFAVAYNSDGSQIVSGSDGNTNNLFVWDAVSGRQIYNFDGHRDAVGSLSFSPDGSKLASGGRGNQNNLFVWDMVTGNQEHDLSGTVSDVMAVAFSPDGTKIAAGGRGNQNNLCIWDATTGVILHNLWGHPAGVSSLAFSSDGKMLVSGGYGSRDNVSVWDVQTGARMHNLIGHTTGSVYSVIFSPDVKMIASGAEGEKSLCIWDVQTGDMLYNLTQGPVISLDWCSHSLAAGGSRDLALWNFSDLYKDLEKLTIPQARLLYQMYCAKESGSTMFIRMDTIDYNAYMDLSEGIKKEICEQFPVVVEGCGVESKEQEQVSPKERKSAGGCCIS